MQFGSENFLKKIAEYQTDIRIKESQVLELTKIQRKLENDIDTVKKKYKEKEYENRRILEDNQKLRSRLKDMSGLQIGENKNLDIVEAEITRRNEEIKRLQDLLKNQEKDFKNKLDGETRRLSKLVSEGDRKLLELKKNIKYIQEPRDTQSNVNYDQIIAKLQADNENLKTELALKVVDNSLEERIKELEMMQILVIEENKKMKEDLQYSLKSRGDGTQNISREINRISKEVHSLLEILKSFLEGKDIPIRQLLSIQEPDIPSLYQVDRDFHNIRIDLNLIRTLIADYHAEQTGNNMCNTQ